MMRRGRYRPRRRSAVPADRIVRKLRHPVRTAEIGLGLRQV